MLQAHIESTKQRKYFYFILWQLLQLNVSAVNNHATQKDQSPWNCHVSKMFNVEAPEIRDCPQNILIPRIQTIKWSMVGVKKCIQ